MQIEMLMTMRAATDPLGNASKSYFKGLVYDMTSTHEIHIAGIFLRDGRAQSLEAKALNGAPENKAMPRPRGRPRKTVVMEG